VELNRICPRIDGQLDPTRYRDCPHVTAFTNEICKYPPVFSKLEVLNLDAHELRSA
jgi:hypothetical protein